jgi:Chaperone of endosialidase
VPVGHLANGLGLYRLSCDDSDKLFVGVIAQEVERVMPDAVRRAPNGYLQVDYARVGVPMMTWDQWVEADQRH